MGENNPILLLAPTSLAAFNIHGKTIRSPSKIPIKYMKPLNFQALARFQEEMRHICYISIHEISFFGPRLFMQIDSCLGEAFPKKKYYPFGGRFLILVGDLGKIPPVKDKHHVCRKNNRESVLGKIQHCCHFR